MSGHCVVSWSSSPLFHAVIPIIGGTQILIVVMLWTPRRTREFFAGRSLDTLARIR